MFVGLVELVRQCATHPFFSQNSGRRQMSQAPAAAIVTVEGAEFSLARHRERQITDTAVVSFFALQKILSADGKISLSIANRCAIAGISLTRLSPPQKNTRLAPGAQTVDKKPGH